MKNVAVLSGKDLCPICHKAMKAIIKYHIRRLVNEPTYKDVVNNFFYVIYTCKYDTLVERFGNPKEYGTPVLLLDNTVYYSILNSKLTEDFLENYKRFRDKLDR